MSSTHCLVLNVWCNALDMVWCQYSALFVSCALGMRPSDQPTGLIGSIRPFGESTGGSNTCGIPANKVLSHSFFLDSIFDWTRKQHAMTNIYKILTNRSICPHSNALGKECTTTNSYSDSPSWAAFLKESSQKESYLCWNFVLTENPHFSEVPFSDSSADIPGLENLLNIERWTQLQVQASSDEKCVPRHLVGQ